MLIGCSLGGSVGDVAILPTPGSDFASVVTAEPGLKPMTSMPKATERPPEAIATTELIPDTGWQLIRPGLERRLITVKQADAAVPEKFYILRIDTDYFLFDVGYHPGEPQRLADWMTETGAFIVVNGGYFTEYGEATGTVIVNGQSFGTGYRGFGGMLTITRETTGLRWLRQQPYDQQESLLAGLQSFPMLVTPGNQIGYPEEDGAPARRTVIAQDNQGRILFVLATSGTFTLHSLSRYLVSSDLNLDMALNLDGGSSTGLIMADPVEGVPPFTLLPLVITVYPKVP